MKFALRDIPNLEQDTKVADHILKLRHYGGTEDEPKIQIDFLKKYVAYARKNIHPQLSHEAGDALKNFFVGMREKVTEDSPIPITLRQYEALIRFAEAAAKVQLRDTVTKEDATRSINLMKSSLRDFGFDIESGTFDIDRLEGRTSASERGKIRILLDIIEDLVSNVGKNMQKEEIFKQARAQGLKDYDTEKMLNELKNTGDLFEPKPGILQKM